MLLVGSYWPISFPAGGRKPLSETAALRDVTSTLARRTSRTFVIYHPASLDSKLIYRVEAKLNLALHRDRGAIAQPDAESFIKANPRRQFESAIG